jgi:hypothetical protein
MYLIFTNNLLDTSLGKKYKILKNKLNDQNYEFFINTVEICEKGISLSAVMDLIDNFKKKIQVSIKDHLDFIPLIVEQSKYVLKEPLKYLEKVNTV